jgi:hypothetical protein
VDVAKDTVDRRFDIFADLMRTAYKVATFRQCMANYPNPGGY